MNHARDSLTSTNKNGQESARERARQALLKSQASKKRARSLAATTSLTDNRAPQTSRQKLSQPLKTHSQTSQPPSTACKPSSQKSNGTKLSQFEEIFGSVAKNCTQNDEVNNADRISHLAADMEWSMIAGECKRLAAQEQIEERMEAAKEIQVSAFYCQDCGVFSESRRPGCASHNVRRVQATKRWFQCGSCGHRTTSIARRFPQWYCDRCRVQDWHPCSMYIIPKDHVGEMHNELHGYASKETLKISGPDFDTRL